MTIQQKPIIHGRDHLPGGPDPIPGFPSPVGDDVEDIIKALPGLAAFWKLDEQSGTVAADSSGNDHDLQPGGGAAAPTWAQETAPTGDTSALFVDDSDALNDNADVAMSAFTDNFSAGIWVSLDTVAANQELIGQGKGGHSLPGWTLAFLSAKPAVLINGDNIQGNNDLATDTWYFIACVRDAGTFKLYVNGLVQADTMTTSFTGSINSWLGNDGSVGHTTYLRNGLLSYGFMVDGVLSSDELLEIYETATFGGFVDNQFVWTSNGDGTASWAEPTIAVEF